MKWRFALAQALLLVALGLLVRTSSDDNSVTMDESAHLPLGLAALRTGNPGYALMHGPLPQLLAAWPLRSDPEVRCELPLPRDDTDFWLAAKTFQEQNPSLYLDIFRRARVPNLILALLLGLLIYLWARARADRLTGLLALFFFALCPNLIAHAGLATTDLAVTAFSVAFVAGLWFYLQRPSWTRLIPAGAALGAALLSKYTGGLFVFLAPLLLFWGAPKDRPRLPAAFGLGRQGRWTGTIIAFLALGGVAWLVVLLGYQVDHPFTPLGAFTFKSAFWQGLQAALPGWLPVPFPRQLIIGIDLQSFDIARPWPLYLLGRLSTRGWRYYQLVVLLYKLPLALLIALALGLPAGAQTFLKGRRHSCLRRELLWTLFPALAWIAALSFLGSSQFGVRLLLPAFPFLQVFAAETLARWLRRSCWSQSLALVLLIWYAADAGQAYPFYLSYFNRLAGGPGHPNHGQEILLDSNLDWDQDWLRLARWQERRRVEEIRYAQFGVISPEVYGVKGRPLGCGPVRGYVAVSVNLIFGLDPAHLQGPCYTWLRYREPLDKIGSSIWIYHFGSAG
jgi:4-amino-4-deoxy-L-arabinose transferase-like glycosyltransferase